MSADEPGPSVLLVDDDPTTAESLAALLGRRRHRVRVARTDAEALAGLADATPDVAIVDLDVGPMTADTLEHLDKRPLLIALLKPSSAQGFARKRLSSFDYVFFKAVSPEILVAKIAEFVARRTRPA